MGGSGYLFLGNAKVRIGHACHYAVVGKKQNYFISYKVAIRISTTKMGHGPSIILFQGERFTASNWMGKNFLGCTL